MKPLIWLDCYCLPWYFKLGTVIAVEQNTFSLPRRDSYAKNVYRCPLWKRWETEWLTVISFTSTPCCCSSSSSPNVRVCHQDILHDSLARRRLFVVRAVSPRTRLLNCVSYWSTGLCRGTPRKIQRQTSKLHVVLEKRRDCHHLVDFVDCELTAAVVESSE